MPTADRKHQCSIGGIKVVHKSSSLNTGRPHKTHTSATRDYSEVEALPFPSEMFSEEVDVVGDNFDLIVLQILELLAGKGPVEYVHPTRGPLYVVLQSPAVVTERPDRVVNKTRLRFDFKVAAVEPPVGPKKLPATVKAKIAIAQAGLDADFDAAVDTNKLGFADLIKNVVGKILDAADFIGGINGTVAGKLAIVSSLTSAIKELERSVNTLVHTPDLVRASLMSLVIATGNLVKTATERYTSLAPFRAANEAASQGYGQALGAVGGADGQINITRPVDASITMLSAMKKSNELELDVSEIPTGDDQTPERAAELEATQAIQRWTRATLVMQLAGSLTDVEWESESQVRHAMAVLQAEIAKVRGDTGHSPETIRSLRAVTLALVAYLDSQRSRLPELRIVSTKRARSIVLLAYDLFGDAYAYPRLLSRNVDSITDPGRLRSDTDLEVLGD